MKGYYLIFDIYTLYDHNHQHDFTFNTCVPDVNMCNFVGWSVVYPANWTNENENEFTRLHEMNVNCQHKQVIS